MSKLGRFWIMVLSFAMSMILWVYVQVQENPNPGAGSMVPIPIADINLPEGYIVLEQPQFLRVVIDGQDSQRLNMEDVVAELDLSKAHPGTDNYPIRVKTLRNYNVTFDPKMSMAQVTLDMIVQNVRKPVTVQAVRQLRDPNREYVPGSTTTVPSFVNVYGPRSIVERVKSAQAILDLATVTSGATTSSEVQLVDDKGNPVTSPTLKFDPHEVLISAATTFASESRHVLVQPVFKGQPAFGYRVKRVDVTPNEIEVRGRTDALSRISSIPTDPIDITGISHTIGYTVKPVIPGQLAVSGAPTINVVVVLEPTPPASTHSEGPRKSTSTHTGQ